MPEIIELLFYIGIFLPPLATLNFLGVGSLVYGVGSGVVFFLDISFVLFLTDGGVTSTSLSSLIRCFYLKNMWFLTSGLCSDEALGLPIFLRASKF